MNFSGKVLLLSGAAGGIGIEIASQFYAAGANLVLGDLDYTELNSFATSLDPDGERVTVSVLDTTKAADVARIVELAQKKFGAIDFLVPAAGVYSAGRLIQKITDEEWHRVMSVNIDGVFYLVRSALPLMRDGGSIVNIASVVAHRGSHSHAHYSASKGALVAFTRSLALEVSPRLRVNAVSPGTIKTKMTEDLLREEEEWLLERTPLRRIGSPREVASVVAFLCSDMASYVHGEVIHVNGGFFMAG